MDDPTDRGSERDQANEELHHAASLSGSSQTKLVNAAIDEHAEHHRERFVERMDKAQRALIKGKAATLAHSLGISEQDVERLGGVTDGRDATSCDAKRNPKSGEPL